MSTIITVSTDLIFATKISSTAGSMRIATCTVRDVAALTAALDNGTVRLVIVDMSLPEDASCEALRTAAGHASLPERIAFYSHVDGRLGEAALAAGAGTAMTRSRFVEGLPDLLARFAPESEPEG